MASRAIWKGDIRFGRVRLPVKLYSVVEEKTIHFHLLHDQDKVRLKQRLVNPETGDTVSFGDAEKAAEVDRGVFVKITKDDLESLEPEASRDIQILRFIPQTQLGLQWYARPYYLGPDDDRGDYFAFAAALAGAKRVGIARWVMRKKQYVGAVRAEGDYLVLNALRFSDDVIPEKGLEPPSGAAIDKKERALAEQLIDVLEEDFRPKDYHDEHRQRVLELIAAKQRGKKIVKHRIARKPKPSSLEASLRASLKRVKQAQA